MTACAAGFWWCFHSLIISLCEIGRCSISGPFSGPQTTISSGSLLTDRQISCTVLPARDKRFWVRFGVAELWLEAVENQGNNVLRSVWTAFFRGISAAG